jgi:hypothetical protein
VQVRLNDSAATVGITHPSVFGIVTDLAEDGHVGEKEDTRPNRWSGSTGQV